MKMANLEEIADERDRRSRENNIILHGVKETENPTDENTFVDKFLTTLEETEKKPNFIGRIGNKEENKKRPIKIAFKNENEKHPRPQDLIFSRFFEKLTIALKSRPWCRPLWIFRLANQIAVFLQSITKIIIMR